MRGYTLVEVMVALGLIGFALLGASALSIKSRQRAMSAYYLGVATHQVNQWREINFDKIHPEIIAWEEENKRLLPSVTMSAASEAGVKLCWQYGGEQCVTMSLV